MACVRASILALCLSVAPLWSASAAPPPDADVETATDPEDQCECDEVLTVDECVLARAIELNGQGQEKFDGGDYVGAIAVWKEAMTLLPESKRVRLAAPLATAHARAYQVDGSLDHLREAKTLFEAHLANLDASNELAREAAQAELSAIEVEFDRLDDERDEKIRAEEAVLREQALAQAESDNRVRIRKIYTVVGGSTMGLGALSMATMVIGLWYGESRDRKGQTFSLDVNIPDSEYQTLLNQGSSANATAAVTGAIGGALLVSGAALIVIGALKYKDDAKVGGATRERDQARLRVQPHGLGFRF